MTTDTFTEFLAKQEHDRAETRRIAEAVDKLTRDVAAIHSSRHNAQEALSVAISEIRLDHSTLEEQVTKLVASMRELVIAMEGNLGSKGIIGRIEILETRMDQASSKSACLVHREEMADLDERVETLEGAVKEVRGMGRLIGWGSGLIAVAAAVKAFFVK